MADDPSEDVLLAECTITPPAMTRSVMHSLCVCPPPPHAAES